VPYHEVSAKFPDEYGDERNACCFDPRIVLHLMREEFGDAFESDFKDRSWRDHQAFLYRQESEGESPGIDACLRISENDAMRRGPNFCFYIHWEGQTYQGNAERYGVRLSSLKVGIPAELRRRFRSFLESLPLLPFKVRAVEIEGNTSTDLE